LLFQVSPKIRALTVWRASHLRLHILNRKKRTLRHGHPVVPIFASRTCHQGARHDEQFDSRNVWGVMAKKVFRPCDGGVHVALYVTLINTQPSERAGTAGRPIHRRDLRGQHGRKPIGYHRSKASRLKMMSDGRQRVTAWPRLALAQSAQDVGKLGPSAISEYRYASKSKVPKETLWLSFRWRSSFTTAGSALRSTSESC
jgi:hypothetical protein